MSQVNNLRTIKLVDDVEKEQYLAQMKTVAEKRFQNQFQWNNENVLELVELACLDLTDEECSEEQTTENVDFVKMCITSGESISDIIDMQREIVAEKHCSMYELFWLALQALLDEHAAIPDERRHGLTQCISPLCTSLRELMEKTRLKMLEMFPNADADSLRVPSEEWTRRQFVPRNPRARVAASYKGRFNVKPRLLRTTFTQKVSSRPSLWSKNRVIL